MSCDSKNQIEEMAKIIDQAKHDMWVGECPTYAEHSENIAKYLYNADYRKQSEGKWIEHGEIGAMNNYWECSSCHWETVSFTEMKHSKFCPNCGARMKGDEGE